jgi:5-methyltetrahydropteroyltriglutamate--homocysteine methyltransferase
LADPYRADNVGSLLRPPELLRARDDAAAGRISADDLRSAEDAATLAAIDLQQTSGISVISDGELRRRAWMTDLAEAVEGFTPAHISIEWHGPDGGVEGSFAQVAGARLRQVRRLTQHEADFLRQHAQGPVKMTVPAPSNFMAVGFQQGVTDSFYPTRMEFAKHVAEIIRGELVALANEGVPYLQLDAPYYCSYLDERLREQMHASGIDPHRALEDAIAVDNASLEGVARQGITTAIHICRGNSRSRWMASGGYDSVAERLFGDLQVDRFLLEYDDERSGDFSPLRYVPATKSVVLGLITTKSGVLEQVDDLRGRIEAAGRYVPIDKLAISPQCGFASVAAGNQITMDDQRRKLELVAETARRVWG